MCGRYAINFEDGGADFKEIIAEINQKYARTKTLAQMKTGEIFPSDTVPVLAGRDAQPFLMRWGFPRWDEKGLIINARSETAMEKKLFRPSLLSRRCAVAATGFYEWAHGAPKKEPTLFDYADSFAPGPADAPLPKGKYLLCSPQSSVLYMAGFFGAELSAPKSEAPPAFVILTTGANQWVSPLHSRMPLLLEGGEVSSWLSSGAAAADILSRPCKARLSMRPG